MAKYKITKTKKEYYGKVLYQIEALKDFSNVKKGELGGWIEKESNLSQENSCWVSDNAWVFGDARVSDNAMVYGNARVSGDAWVFGDAEVYGNVKLIGGRFYHTKSKSEKIETVDTTNGEYETLCFNPELGEEEKTGKKVRIKLADNQIVEGEIVED